MTKYCKCDFLNNLLDNRLPIVIRNGYSLEKDKEIPYGIQLFFTKNSEDDGTEKKFIINLYYTEKKGLKIVSNIKKEDADNEKLIDIISEFKNNNAVSNLTNFNVRIGTDESGKGDYFGPLVTAGFIVDNSIVPDLIKIGIQDSKRISDENIKKWHNTYMIIIVIE